MDLQARLAKITADAKARADERKLALLDTDTGINNYLASEDRKVLNSISTRIASAYDKPTITGYQFSENIELMVAITNRLQYANKSVRELLEPGTDEVDLYQIFDRSLRDDILDAYGALPYKREATKITLPDGTVEVLDQHLVDLARQGRKCDIDKLNGCLEILALRLGLYTQYKATKAQADLAWEQAESKLVQIDKLKAYEDSLQA